MKVAGGVIWWLVVVFAKKEEANLLFAGEDSLLNEHHQDTRTLFEQQNAQLYSGIAPNDHQEVEGVLSSGILELSQPRHLLGCPTSTYSCSSWCCPTSSTCCRYNSMSKGCSSNGYCSSTPTPPPQTPRTPPTTSSPSCPANYGKCASWCCPLGGNTCCSSNPQSSGCTSNGICSTSSGNTPTSCPSSSFKCLAGWCCTLGSTCCNLNSKSSGCSWNGVCSSNPTPSPTTNWSNSCPASTYLCSNQKWCCPSSQTCCNSNSQSQGCSLNGVCSSSSSSSSFTSATMYSNSHQSCFPSTALVELPERQFRQMKDLKLGDLVMGDEEGNFYPIVYFSRHGFPFRDDSQAMGQYLNLTTLHGNSLSISVEHFVILCDGSLRAARNLKVEDLLLFPKLTPKCQQISHLSSPYLSLGAYSPMTSSGMLVVNGVLVSCFTENTVINPTVALVIFQVLQGIQTYTSTRVFNFLSTSLDFVIGGIELCLPWIVTTQTS